MRKSSFSRRMLGCLLGMQLFCFVAARSQSTYAYSNVSSQALQQKNPGDNGKPDENVQKETLFNVESRLSLA